MKKLSLLLLLPFVTVALVSASCEQMNSPSELEISGDLKIALVSHGGSFSGEIVLFFLTEDDVYHLAFDRSCGFRGGGSQSAASGYPMNACGTTVSLRSDAAYRVSGRLSETGEQLAGRKTSSLVATVIELVDAGEGESYAHMAYRTDDGDIFVTDGQMRIYRRQGMPAFSSDGAVIKLSEPASWAAPDENNDEQPDAM